MKKTATNKVTMHHLFIKDSVLAGGISEVVGTVCISGINPHLGLY